MSYVGSSAAVIPVAFSGVNSQSFNGNGSTVAFTLNRPVSAVNAIEVMVNNVQQSPYDSSYSVSSTTLTFSAAPSTGTANIYVVYRDFPVGSITDPNTYTKAQADTLLADRVAKTGDTMTGNLSVTNSSSTTPTGYFQNTSGSGDSPALIARGGANNTNTVGTFEVQSYGGNKQLKVDGNGRVTMPYQPAFNVIEGNTTGSIIFTQVISNVGNHYSTSTGRFTAPVSGHYFFAFTGGNNSTFGVDVQKNGTKIRRVEVGSPAGFYWSTVSSVIYMVSGDYANCNCFVGAASSNGNQGGFSGYLVG